MLEGLEVCIRIRVYNAVMCISIITRELLCDHVT